MITEKDLQWWARTWGELRWTFASTMPGVPHSYVVKGRTMDPDDFERAVKVIRTFGQPGKFYGRTNIYLTLGDRKWWTMGAPLEETIIINMATTDKVYGTQDAPSTATDTFTVYDALATEYDRRYLGEEDLKENETIRRLITRHFGAYAPSVLDIGCGTGLLLDLGVTSPAVFTGIDPSQGMLNELIRKHPKVRSIIPGTFEEAWEQVRGKRYDAVVSLFGSPSYIAPEFIAKIPALSRDLVVLMHYVEGYLPDYHNDDPEVHHAADLSRKAARELGGRRYRLNNFEVTVLDV